MIFIQKGEAAEDPDGHFLREPGKTRPLTLSNTDAKTVSKAAAVTVTAIATDASVKSRLVG